MTVTEQLQSLLSKLEIDSYSITYEPLNITSGRQLAYPHIPSDRMVNVLDGDVLVRVVYFNPAYPILSNEKGLAKSEEYRKQLLAELQKRNIKGEVMILISSYSMTDDGKSAIIHSTRTAYADANFEIYEYMAANAKRKEPK